MQNPTCRIIALAVATLAAAALAGDWPHWGGDGARNMVSPARNLPVEFVPGETNDDGDIDLSTSKNVKWVARLGSQTYGNPTIANGRIFVGTNNDSPRDPRYEGDYGIVLCLDEATGKLLWQLAVPKLAVGNVSDYEFIGICSSPAVDGDRVYLVSTRGEVLCLDVRGMANGNDGPFQDEAQYTAGPGKPPIPQGPTDADIIWRYDLRDELGVFINQAASSSILIVGDRLYVTTSNGRDWTRKHIPAPNAPALICLDRNTGKLLGQDKSGISQRMFLCNWSTPALAKVDGRDLIIFGGDDGWCYAFEPEPVDGVLREVWRFDCNPPHYRIRDGRVMKPSQPNGPSGILATPVFVDGRVFISIGQDPEHGDGPGALSCIDPAHTGDITHTGRVWQNDRIRRSLSTPGIVDGLLFIADFAGFVYCIDAATGEQIWRHDTQGTIWGSILVADGKLYIGTESGDLTILRAGRKPEVISTVHFAGPLYSTPVVANGVLYIATDRHLFAIKAE
jgi:outer membrane protein assembly factor BamB